MHTSSSVTFRGRCHMVKLCREALSAIDAANLKAAEFRTTRRLPVVDSRQSNVRRARVRLSRTCKTNGDFVLGLAPGKHQVDSPRGCQRDDTCTEKRCRGRPKKYDFTFQCPACERSVRGLTSGKHHFDTSRGCLRERKKARVSV